MDVRLELLPVHLGARERELHLPLKDVLRWRFEFGGAHAILQLRRAPRTLDGDTDGPLIS
ncbi:hypothetical protein D3C87_2058360 [compost metagenome]